MFPLHFFILQPSPSNFFSSSTSSPLLVLFIVICQWPAFVFERKKPPSRSLPRLRMPFISPYIAPLIPAALLWGGRGHPKCCVTATFSFYSTSRFFISATPRGLHHVFFCYFPYFYSLRLIFYSLLLFLFFLCWSSAKTSVVYVKNVIALRPSSWLKIGTGPLREKANDVRGACAARRKQQLYEKQQQSLQQGLWSRDDPLKLSYVAPPPLTAAISCQSHCVSMVPSPWTWPVKAGMLAEASSSSPTSTRTTRKAGPGVGGTGSGASL